jgi:Fe-S cluster assembly protein SufD
MLEPQIQELLSQDDALSSWRKKYWDKFRDLGSLELKQEAFQYISLSDLELPKSAKEKEVKSCVDVNHPFHLVFIDGFFSLERSSFPDDVVCLPLDVAIHSYGVFLQNRMVRTMKDELDPFAALNGAFVGRGAFLYIPPKKQIGETLIVEHVFTGAEMTTPRLVLNLGRQSSLSVLQKWNTDIDTPYFSNAYIDAALDEGANLVLKNIQLQAPKAHLFQSVRASVKRDAYFGCNLYSEGASICRYSMRVQLLEENARALLQGLTRLNTKCQSHVHATVEHLAPHTNSRQHFKALLDDESVSSFEGKIYVHSCAQKTESYQLNNNLLLSDLAKAYAKPNLEIFADDVKASHGATVAQLDKESLFYLMSRGLPKPQAKQCLIQSFVQELADCLP